MVTKQSWVAVDGHGDERVFSKKPHRDFPNMALHVEWGQRWCINTGCGHDYGAILPKGTIKSLVGKEITYNDNPIRLV